MTKRLRKKNIKSHNDTRVFLDWLSELYSFLWEAECDGSNIKEVIRHRKIAAKRLRTNDFKVTRMSQYLSTVW